MSKRTARRSRKLESWPVADREAWRVANEPGDILDPGGAGAAWSAVTRNSVAVAYGRWLVWLDAKQLLDPSVSPIERVTPERVADYVADVRAEYASSSAAAFSAFLPMAMQVMAPEADWRWLQDIAAALRRRAEPVRTKRGRLVLSDELFAFGLELMAEAEKAESGSWQQAVQYRDGLMIALLAARPLRRRNFCAIEIGRHLIRKGDGYELCFPAAETKNRVPIELPFPALLIPHLQRYLTRYRPFLCGLSGHRNPAYPFRPAGDHPWVSKTGSAMSQEVFYKGLMQRTAPRFGRGVNPHLFRNSAATSIAIENPMHVGSTRNILGHKTSHTAERYYNQASSLEAARSYHRQVLALRERARSAKGVAQAGSSDV